LSLAPNAYKCYARVQGVRGGDFPECNIIYIVRMSRSTKQGYDASLVGNENDAKKINKDKCDPNDADCSLWNELPSLLRIYKRQEGVPRLPS
jgi:hypothetical protein